MNISEKLQNLEQLYYLGYFKFKSTTGSISQIFYSIVEPISINCTI